MAVVIVLAVIAGRTLPKFDWLLAGNTAVATQVSIDIVRPGDRFRGTVTRIVDGDTFWISSADVRIRIWGLDAPETRDPGGPAATEALRQLIADRTLTCETRDIDRFRRIVGQCFLPDGRDITRAMIETGTAREFCRFSENHYGTC